MTVPTDRSQRRCFRGESEQRLVKLARGGDVAAFEAIVVRYQEPLLRHCRRMLTPAEAEDAVQEAFLAAYRTINRTAPDLRLGAWLFRIAHNAALGILGRRVATASLEDLPVATESAYDAMQSRQQLRDTLGAISTLPETERRALVARVLAGTGHREIAMELGRSEGAVRQLLYRARARLRESVAALTPLFVRLAPKSVGDRFADLPFAARGGAILAVGLTAVVGGSAVVPMGPAQLGQHSGDEKGVSHRALSSALPREVASFDRRSLGDRGVFISFSERMRSRRGDRATQRVSMTRLGGRAGGRIHRGSTERGMSIHRIGTASTAPGSGSGNPGTGVTQPVARAGLPGGSTVSTASHTNARPEAPQTAFGPKQHGAAPGQARATPGQSGAAPGQSGAAPGQSGAAPGQSGAAPGQSGAAPGQSGAAPGQSGAAPGQSGAAPGQSGSTPVRLTAPSQP